MGAIFAAIIPSEAEGCSLAPATYLSNDAVTTRAISIQHSKSKTDLVPEFVQSFIVYSKVMSDFVNHRDPHLKDKVFFVFRHLLQRPLEDGDDVRENHPVTLSLGQRNAFIQAEQRLPRGQVVVVPLLLCWPVRCDNAYVVQAIQKFVRQAVDRLGDQPFKCFVWD